MEHVLIKDRKYEGQYVAIKDFNKPEVIAAGKDPQKVYKRALKSGVKEPVIIYIPTKDIVQIYKVLC